MPRMRTAVKLYELVREQDPDSEVTLHYIRQLIATEAIPVLHVGRKKLVDTKGKRINGIPTECFCLLLPAVETDEEIDDLPL